MKDQELKMIIDMLGNTANQGWAILVAQAPIQATIILFQYLMLAFFGSVLWRANKYFETKGSRYNYNDDWPTPVMMIGLGLFAICILISFFSIPDVINGYCSPEYWAAEKILNSIN